MPAPTLGRAAAGRRKRPRQGRSPRRSRKHDDQRDAAATVSPSDRAKHERRGQRPVRPGAAGCRAAPAAGPTSDLRRIARAQQDFDPRRPGRPRRGRGSGSGTGGMVGIRRCRALVIRRDDRLKKVSEVVACRRTCPDRRGRSRDAERPDRARARLGLYRRGGRRRRRGAREGHGLPAVDRRHRPRDAAHERHRAAQGAAARDREHQGDPADRAGHRRHRGRGRQGRRRGLPDQAARSEQAAAAARAARGDQPAEAREPGAAPAAERSRPVRPHHRPQPGDARALSGARTGGADAGVDVDPRRVRHRQGAGRADHPPAEPARRGAVCRDQLRGDSRHAARERDLRPREGRVHRRDRSPRRLLRARRSRHAVPRRDRRDDAGDAGQAAARPAGAEVPPARRPHRAGSGRARAGRDQHRSGDARSATASSARTSTIASTSSPSRCRRCAIARTTWRC